MNRKTHMRTVSSKDGTIIAFDQLGKGPALILVGGSLEHRALDAETSRLAVYPLMAQHFTLFHYDRRGRGDSTDTQLYAVQREIEDIEALINEAGGSVFISGISSGGALAMEATIALPGKIKKLAVYEAPYNWPGFKDYRNQLNELVAAGRKGEALAAFMIFLGVPADQLNGVRQLPMWPMWESVAHTLAYENVVLGNDAAVPVKRAAKITVPTLIMDGEVSSGMYPFIHDTAVTLAKAIPNARYRSLEGQTHEVTPEALAPALVEFFQG
jgi:pimeloyl-ACP methyl ester carboxylesterase